MLGQTLLLEPVDGRNPLLVIPHHVQNVIPHHGEEEAFERPAGVDRSPFDPQLDEHLLKSLFSQFLVLYMFSAQGEGLRVMTLIDDLECLTVPFSDPVSHLCITGSLCRCTCSRCSSERFHKRNAFGR